MSTTLSPPATSPAARARQIPRRSHGLIHYVKPALMGPGQDANNPEILLYLPGKDGSLRLVGVEYFQADADQDLATDGDRPSFVRSRLSTDRCWAHSPQMPIHYDLHVWVDRSRTRPACSPSGTPPIRCPS